MEAGIGGPVVVVAALVGARTESGGPAVLLARRAQGQRHAGYWELPGGKVEPGEEPERALERELFEELGVAARVLGSPRRYSASLEGRAFEFLVFPTLLEGEPELSVHDALRAVAPAELPAYRLAPLDEPALADWVRGLG